MADYTTPIKNYFQCGSGTHPEGVLQVHLVKWRQKDFRNLEMSNYDVIIIGAGINGLATASVLGKAENILLF